MVVDPAFVEEPHDAASCLAGNIRLDHFKAFLVCMNAHMVLRYIYGMLKEMICSCGVIYGPESVRTLEGVRLAVAWDAHV